MEKYKVVRQPILTKSVRSIVENQHVLSFNSNVLACFSSYIGTPLITFWVRNHLVFHVLGMLQSTDCSTYEHLRMRICKAKELGCISKCGHFVFHIEGTCFAEYKQMHRNLQLTKHSRQMQLDVSVYRWFEN